MRFPVGLNCLVIGWNCPRDRIILMANQHEASTVCRHITEDLCVEERHNLKKKEETDRL